MALTSLIVSIVAVVISVAAVAYTRSQARSAKGSLAIESARRLEERRPQLSGKVEMVRGSAHRLMITLVSDEPIGGLRVHLRYGQGAEFDRNVYGVWPVPGPASLR